MTPISQNYPPIPTQWIFTCDFATKWSPNLPKLSPNYVVTVGTQKQQRCDVGNLLVPPAHAPWRPPKTSFRPRASVGAWRIRIKTTWGPSTAILRTGGGGGAMDPAAWNEAKIAQGSVMDPDAGAMDPCVFWSFSGSGWAFEASYAIKPDLSQAIVEVGWQHNGW